MVSQKRRVKMINKLLKEFYTEYKKISHCKSIVLNQIEISDFPVEFREQVKTNQEDFFNCVSSSLNDINLCKSINIDNIDMDGFSCENKKNIWKYLHNLYILTLEDVQTLQLQEIYEKSKNGLENIEIEEKSLQKQSDKIDLDFPSLLSSLNENNEMKNLIEELTFKFSKKLEGKDLSNINPMNLMASLMSGNSSSGGIDFGDILKDVSESVQEKIKKGELDVNNLKSQAEKIMKM